MEKLLKRFGDFVPNIIISLVIFAVGYVVIRLVLKILKKVFSHSRIEETGWRFILSAIRAALYVMLFVMILSELNVPMTSIITALGTAGITIGLALRDSLSNVAGGFIVMFGQLFKVGDFVEIDGKQGYVNNITILNTRLLTMDNRAVLIPNSKVSNATIVNFTQEDLRRLELNFNISYSSDIVLAERVLLETVEANPLSLDKPDKPFIRISEQGDHAMVILLRVWVKTSDYWELRYGLLADVKQAFDREGIIIPFGQLDIHLDKE